MAKIATLSSKMGLWLSLFITLIIIVSGYGYYYIFVQYEAEQQRKILLSSGADLSSSLNSNLVEKIRVIQTLVATTEVETLLAESNFQYNSLSPASRTQLIKAENDKWKSRTSIDTAFARERLASKAAQILNRHVNDNPDVYGEIFLTNKFGAVVGMTGELSTIAHAHKYWWKAAFADGVGKVFIDDRGFDESVGGVVLGLVIPVKKSGKVIGILKANLDMKALFSSFINVKDRSRDYKVSIYRSGGLVVFDEQFAPLKHHAPEKVAALLGLKEAVGRSYIDVKGSHFWVSVPIPLTMNTGAIGFGGKPKDYGHTLGNAGEHWDIVLSKDNFHLDLGQEKTEALFIFLVSFIVLVPFFGAWIVKVLLQPLRRLSDDIENFDLEVGFESMQTPSSRELEVLSTAFRHLTERLGETVVSRDELSIEMEQRSKIENILDVFFNQTLSLNIIAGKDNRIKKCNAGLEAILGYSSTEMIGTSFWDLMCSKEDDCLTEVRDKLQKSGSILFEHKHTHKDGSDRFLAWSVYVEPTEQNVYAVATDISDKMEIDMALRQAHKIEAVGNLAGGIAHNVNNMLLPILTLTEMTIRELPKESRAHKRLEKVVEAGQRAKDLIDGIMAFSRRDDAAEVKKETDIVALVQDTTEFLKSTLPSTISLVKGSGVDVALVYCDPAQISTILVNMMSNSIDAIEGNVGKIEITVTIEYVTQKFAQTVPHLAAGNFVKIAISDTGCGMLPMVMTKVFDPFFTTKRVGDGTGLGLSTAHGIVVKSGGAIHVHSELDVGTTFTIFLPLLDQGK